MYTQNSKAPFHQRHGYYFEESGSTFMIETYMDPLLNGQSNIMKGYSKANNSKEPGDKSGMLFNMIIRLLSAKGGNDRPIAKRMLLMKVYEKIDKAAQSFDGNKRIVMRIYPNMIDIEDKSSPYVLPEMKRYELLVDRLASGDSDFAGLKKQLKRTYLKETLDAYYVTKKFGTHEGLVEYCKQLINEGHPREQINRFYSDYTKQHFV